MVPESGRFITSFMQLTVVAPACLLSRTFQSSTNDAIEAPVIRTGGQPVQEWLVRQLTSVWVDFESALRQVPIVKKIYNGSLTLNDYKLLLVNLQDNR